MLHQRTEFLDDLMHDISEPISLVAFAYRHNMRPESVMEIINMTGKYIIHQYRAGLGEIKITVKPVGA